MIRVPAAILAASIALIPPAALAAMGADEFDAFTRGKTFIYTESGQAYGAEEYLENRRVRWSFLDGQCKEGEWYPSGEQICFVYDDDPGPQCWTFRRQGAGLSAVFAGDPEGDALYGAHDAGEPMMCLGPEIGV